ncbi:PilN domain-containing protein [Pseudohalioglobus sediminis]|uniref:PilN domain-containing protein n=1 Tax=Pseudohalioglobus sediminis TaxID=2606449 RepID=A0A5B0WV25_9GAMM|nr:PilN domain-containing protein [Pseudohalioglobus sediminis]KAA1189739.1 PilN domain-containing protein [Pseudohalioglobus sediminis]
MAQINLLPWREERRQELKKEFLVTLALVAFLGAGLVLLGDRVVNGQIDHQKARNNYLTQNIKELDKKVAEIRNLQKRRQQLIERMRVIQELQGNRPIIVRIMDQLVRTIPDGVFYTSLASSKGKIKIDGIAESNNRVSSLMRRLDGSDWLASPNLDKVKAATKYGDQATTFNLTVKVELPKVEEQQGGK